MSGHRSSPSFVREPEGNGVAERFIRTLKENLLWVRTFKTIEEDHRSKPSPLRTQLSGERGAKLVPAEPDRFMADVIPRSATKSSTLGSETAPGELLSGMPDASVDHRHSERPSLL
jgi:hypothetical protein